ncbi:unnamed protein product [Mycena citricolor]|uniref:cutinase n=1 Tax=Mycena citricolor TaxID=2018698 RepID=A0AAD2Q174_9AGAR|nr:unnamed protein product [Mycena citricolor]
MKSQKLSALLCGLAPLVQLCAHALPTSAAPRAACADVMVFFARGTTEPAPIGTLVGPPLAAALQRALRAKGNLTLAFAGVAYAADVLGFLEGGDPQGARAMANDLTSAASACPKAALVTAGYSQGGQLVHNSARLLSPAVQARISAAVIFGDPDNGSAVSGVSALRTHVVCHAGDDICLHGDLVLEPHLTYGADTPSAAAFIAGKV